jgi:alpha-tubulin suppressor-like RCC1 family protein
LKCWGWNIFGELGNGSHIDSNIPVDVNGFSGGVSAISAGIQHTCALNISGGVKCWGYNAVGQLGDGTYADSKIPIDVVGLSTGVSVVSAGYAHTCAITLNGGIKCWGGNLHGELGNSTNTTSTSLHPGSFILTYHPSGAPRHLLILDLRIHNTSYAIICQSLASHTILLHHIP